ncbi:MAG: tRNA pseudouridine(38-40) synthase TruA [Nitrospiraceae bacterium]|nr:tRNA pseudouridine(38-40) synthase TruA [Nitrospiraceae bacterium]
MRNIKLVIQYDGTNYHGWQIQNSDKTIQGILEEKLSNITGEKISLTSASRTDAGVHAFAQVASFLTASNLETLKLQKALNSLLPEDIKIIEAEEASSDFHPRYDSLGKTYFYLISNTPYSSAFLYRYAWHLPFSLDLSQMKKAGRFFKGRHDFSSFRGSGCGAKTPIREITSLKIEKIKRIDFMTASFKGDYIKITIEANAFLRHMVRNIVGTLVEAGRGKISPDYVKKILLLKDRKAAGINAPAKGLFLEKIHY